VEVGDTVVLPVEATVPTAGSILIDVAPITPQINVDEPPVLIVEGIAPKFTICGGVATGKQLPAKSVIKIKPRNNFFILLLLETNWA